MRRSFLGYAVEFSIGLTVSSAHPLGLAVAIVMPALAMRQETRRAAYFAALCYYAGALWPLMPGARNFFGSHVTILTALTLWAVACSLLASPWPLVWSLNRRQSWWRTPLGWHSALSRLWGSLGGPHRSRPLDCFSRHRLVGPGILYPRTGATCSLASQRFLASPQRRAVQLVLCAAPPPTGWIAINTHFGGITHGQHHSLRNTKPHRQSNGPHLRQRQGHSIPRNRRSHLDRSYRYVLGADARSPAVRRESASCRGPIPRFWRQDSFLRD